MIDIKNKSECCGCSACVQRCPKQCISLYEDKEGFLYPNIDKESCIDCGLCEKVCPVINQSPERVPLNVYAAVNPNEEIRKQSSSGGIFTLLAEHVIEAGGVVFGVKWNEKFEAVHAYTETKEGIADFRGSKYVQSYIGDAFKQAESFLKQGRQVLFSGTPCQIAALNLFLRKSYDNLFTVDVVCHGVPSPGVFKWYLNDVVYCKPKGGNKHYNNGIKLIDISFRDKTTGWKTPSIRVDYSLTGSNKKVTSLEKGYRNTFLRGFYNDLYLRPSCHSCASKAGKSNSDLTLGDYWGVHTLIPNIDDNKGVSAVLVNTVKGMKYLPLIDAHLNMASYDHMCAKNPMLIKSCNEPVNRSIFFNSTIKSFSKRINSICPISFIKEIKDYMRSSVQGIIKFIK